jgi:hypothetical protein
VLIVGFVLEHRVSFRVKNPGASVPAGKLNLVAAIETVTWVLWLALLPQDPIGATAVLLVGLALGHILELNTVNNLPLFRHFGKRFVQVLDITGIEAVIGTVWVLVAMINPIVAAGILFVGILVEHLISVRKRVVS